MLNQVERVLGVILYLEYQEIDATIENIKECLGLSDQETDDAVYNLFVSRRIAKRGIGKDAKYEVIRSDKVNKRSGVYLTDSGTGSKIVKKSKEFWLCYVDKEQFVDSVLFKFDWKCGSSQNGHISINVRNLDFKISNSSLIDTDSCSAHRFGRALGLYNDNSLLKIFEDALDSIHVKHNGVY